MQFYHPKPTLSVLSLSRSALPFAALLFPIVGLVLPSSGQYPPPPTPTTYPYTSGGTTLVVTEGLVVADSTDPTDDTNAWTRGGFASVAIDSPAEGLPRFLVAWQSDETKLNDNVSYSAILANRFSADGSCITWTGSGNTYGPKALSAHFSCTDPGTISCSNEHYKPTIKMSGDGHVRAAWTAAWYPEFDIDHLLEPHFYATLLSQVGWVVLNPPPLDGKSSRVGCTQPTTLGW